MRNQDHPLLHVQPPAPQVWARRRPLVWVGRNGSHIVELHGYRGTGGIAWPAHATLAERAECCVRTVQRALEAARELGLVSWTARRLRAGWRPTRFLARGPRRRPGSQPRSRRP